MQIHRFSKFPGVKYIWAKIQLNLHTVILKQYNISFLFRMFWRKRAQHYNWTTNKLPCRIQIVHWIDCIKSNSTQKMSFIMVRGCDGLVEYANHGIASLVRWGVILVDSPPILAAPRHWLLCFCARFILFAPRY